MNNPTQLESSARYRSIDPQYIQNIVKPYRFWTLSVHGDQKYLGRSVVWLVREGEMQRFSAITDEEAAELRMVIKEYEAALTKLWKPDFMNYAWLANNYHEHGGHGHMHLIPRYKDDREFNGRIYRDTRWGKNYTPCRIERSITGITIGLFWVRVRRNLATASARSSRARSMSAARGLRRDVSTDLRMMRRFGP
jgi:diadenosine tetraphosphate (Ap4A) HIT family hydrolase